MKRGLEHQYELWQDIAKNGVENFNKLIELRENAETNTAKFQNDINKNLLFYLRKNLLCEKKQHEKNLEQLIEELNLFRLELCEKFDNFLSQIRHQWLMEFLQEVNESSDSPEEDFDDSDDEQQRGLTFQRIQQFEKFQADQSFVDDQCAICMEEIEIGRNMMRLDCDGQHTFCQVCIEGWFTDHNTCPICRYIF